jgi:hypothetical protein
MVVTIGIPTSTKKQGLVFTFIAYTKSKDEKKIIVAKQCSSSYGCTVKPIKGAQSLLRGV